MITAFLLAAALAQASHPQPVGLGQSASPPAGKSDPAGTEAGLAATLELRLQKDPGRKDSWVQLFGTYNDLAARTTHDPKQQHAYWALAVRTIERAQEHGFLKDPRSAYNLVTLHYQMGDYAKAAGLLRAGLRSGAIEDKPDNWTTLGYFDLNAGGNDAEIADLEEGIRHFPEDSDLYFEIGMDYSNDHDVREAYRWYRQAVDHHQFHQQQEAMALYQLGFAAYEMDRYDEALAAVDSALKRPELGDKRRNLERFRKGIEEAIQKHSTEGKGSGL